MTKRLFSLAVMMCLATIAAWADVTSIDSQTQWTFGNYSGQTVKVFNQDGMYLHAAGSFDSFTADSQNMSATSGTFSGTSVEWNTEKKLVTGTGVGSNFLSLGNIDAASEDGADASLAFNHSGSGRLHIVYEAASASDGTFYVQQRKSGETEYTTLYNETMPGRSYTGPLGAPKATNDISTTLQEAIVTLDGNGSVYFGANQPYCIYAVLFVPTYLDKPVYGTYDFQTWAEANMTKNNQATIGLNAYGVMTGAFSPADGEINGTMTLNGVFGINNATAYKLRKNGSTGNSSSGLMITKTGGAKVTINRLQAGDWFVITTDVANRLQFATANTNVHAAGSTETITQNSYVQSGTIYLVTAETTVDLYNKDGESTVYIHKIQISNEDAVAAPVITVGDGNLVTIDGGTSLKGNAVTVYYTTDGSDPTTSETRQVYSAPFTPTETVKIRAYSVLNSDETMVSVEAEPLVIRLGTWEGEVNVFDFAAAANNFLDLTFSDTKTEKAFKYYYSDTQSANSGNFYEITNTEWLTASEGNTSKVYWREKNNATLTQNGGGGIISTGQKYLVVDGLSKGMRVIVDFNSGVLKYATGTGEGEATVDGNTLSRNTALTTGSVITISSGSYIVLNVDAKTVISKITVLEPVPTYTFTIEEMENGTITDAEGNPLEESYAEGTEVTLVAHPAENYKFDYWEINSEKDTEHTTSTLTLTITENTTVKAYFADARVSADGVPVIIVAGQSNTDGRIKTSETAFPYTLNHTLISYCNGDVSGSYPAVDEGNFVTYGTTPRSDAGECWGYDAIIYNNIQTQLGGETDFYVIKQSKGNTAVNTMSTSGNNLHWWSANPVWLERNTSANQGGRSLLKALKDNIDKSLKALEDASKEYDIKFLMWHQGEADRNKGGEYETQLKAVIGEVRNYLVERTGNNKYSNLPVILGGIANVSNEYKVDVETGKQALATADANIYYAPTGTMTLEEDFRSDKVHFNATGAEKLASAVWDIITTNSLMTGITLSGEDTPVVNPLAEEVVSETTTWNFTTAGALTEGQSQNGLYNHRGTVNEKNYGTITLADGSELDGTYAATTNGADRKSTATQGLTAGYTGLTYVYSVNVDGEGTFMAVLRPTKAEGNGYARLMLNGEELQAVAVTSTDENIQLVGKTTGKGTFTVFCGESWDFIGAKFIKGATSIEIMTAPTIEAGSGLNTVKINPGTSDQADATIRTYYTTDGTTPSAESAEYIGTELTLTADCTVKAVSISSKGGVAYSEDYAFTYEEPTAPTEWDFATYYDEHPEAELGMSDDDKITVYYYRASDTSDKNANFNLLTAEPVNSKMSVLSSAMEYASGGLKVTSANRPFAIHGLKVGDAVSIEFVGEIYYAKHSSKGSALEGMTAGSYITTRTAYTVSEQDATNDYVVFYPTQNTYISRIAINQELVEKTEVVSAPAITLRGNYTNRVTITGGVSSKGNSVTTYYTTDGNDPTTESESFTDSYKNFGPYTSDMTFKAMTISETGVQSDIVTFELHVPLFAITLPEETTEGTVTADMTEAVEGQTVRLTVTPAEGYYLAQLTAEGGAEITETNTFRMPASDVIISALFKQEDGHSSETVRENITIIDYDNARLTSIVAGENATTLTVSGDVFGVPVTSISNTAFTEENTSHLAVIDLSETAVTISGNRSELNALKNIHSEALIYMPATASVTGTNVVSKTDTGFTCDDYQLTDGGLCAVPYDFTATTATMNREFVANKKCTVCLPFNFTATGGTFYKFTGINNGKVQMTAQEPNSMLEANTPYIFEPNEGTEAIVSENVEVSISDTPQTDNEEAKFSFIGTYEPIVWDHPSGIYGYAAEQQGLTEVGQFVRVGSGASISACRAYLQYTGEGTISESRGYQSMKKLPERYDIQWIPYGNTTSITAVEQSSDDDDHVPAYNLNGQKVSNSYKGIVIKNGKTMIRK